jgi:uncharacterized protein (UPF0332 family)
LRWREKKVFPNTAVLIGWFNSEYVNTGKVDSSFGRFVNAAWKNRTRGDYQAIVNINREDIESSLSTLHDFIRLIEEILKTGILP